MVPDPKYPITHLFHPQTAEGEGGQIGFLTLASKAGCYLPSAGCTAPSHPRWLRDCGRSEDTSDEYVTWHRIVSKGDVVDQRKGEAPMMKSSKQNGPSQPLPIHPLWTNGSQ
ncbi:hypothetical protein J3458_021708 [Metarhizium acridum]|uniref:uncharacterized protein n=1 Tax=Metarhizium acridum TaxID=92637 RepID=UPI001C6BB5BD|nr:hypothetical protein J3458_021708 [Metarhizium acridum]